MIHNEIVRSNIRSCSESGCFRKSAENVNKSDNRDRIGDYSFYIEYIVFKKFFIIFSVKNFKLVAAG